jgi:hypothetical protein
VPSANPHATNDRPPSRRTAAGLICDGRGVGPAVATCYNAVYPIARRPVVNVGSILGEPVESPSRNGLASDERSGTCLKIVLPDLIRLNGEQERIVGLLSATGARRDRLRGLDTRLGLGCLLHLRKLDLCGRGLDRRPRRPAVHALVRAVR